MEEVEGEGLYCPCGFELYEYEDDTFSCASEYPLWANYHNNDRLSTLPVHHIWQRFPPWFAVQHSFEVSDEWQLP